jgi:hypothetical protein
MKLFNIFKSRTYHSGNSGLEKKINLADELKGFYGQHRSGWLWALGHLKPLHDPKGILFDSFIERTFCWNPAGIQRHEQPWIGFIHVPPNVPRWFRYDQSNDFIFQTEAWKESLPYCRGLFTLSRYHKVSLESKLALPINNLIFPTETPLLKWTWERFQANKEKKIIQVGWWLRKLHTIFQLPARTYKKIFLRITHADIDGFMKKEREILVQEGQFQDSMYETAESVTYIPHQLYDEWLSENLIIVNLYDSSANNTLIECIVRNTPLLINPIEPVVEYLGRSYPLYFSSLQEAADKAEDPDLIMKAHLYLIDHPLKEKLTGEYFMRSLANSEVYRSL